MVLSNVFIWFAEILLWIHQFGFSFQYLKICNELIPHCWFYPVVFPFCDLSLCVPDFPPCSEFFWAFVSSCCFLGLWPVGRVMSAETDKCGEANFRRTCDIGRGINRTQETVRGAGDWADLGLLVELAVQSLLVSCLHWSSPGVLHGPSCWLKLRLRSCCLCWLCHCCWFVFAIITLLNWTAGVSMKCLWVDWAASADLWIELQISWQCRRDLLKNHF